ncbi:MAG: VWA domain-containing protein [Acidobacteriota bacterium]
MKIDPNIEIITNKPKLIAGEKRSVDVLVRITPPDLETNGPKRPKLNIGVALDRSGSMDGEKMHQAREAAKYCVDQLLSSDIFSAVIFDDQVDVLFTSQAAADKEMLKRGIDRIEARNSTALHEGWVKAGLQVSEKLDAEAINRILLITDGQANVGETNIDRIVTQAKETAARGVSTTTIGIGSDFNEDLLMPMAEAGQGNAWHVQEPQDMLKIFETELHGLVRQFGNGVRLNIRTADGVRVTDVLNDFEKDGAGGYVLPNLIAGSKLEIVVRLEVGPDASAEHLASFDLNFIRQQTGDADVMTSVLSVEFGGRSEVEALPENVDVVRAVQLLMNARARREAMSQLDAGLYDAARSTMQAAVGSTEVLFSLAPSLQLREELDDLSKVAGSLGSRQNDAMSRKQMAYSRESRRKGR